MDRLVTPPPQFADTASESHSDRFPLRRSDLLLIFGFWTFMALLTSANSLIDPRARGLTPISPSAPVALAFIEAYVWAVITPFVFWCASRFQLERAQWLPRAALLFVVGMSIAVSVDVLVGMLRFDVFYVATGRLAELGPVWRLTHLWFINEFIVFIAILAGGIARDYFLRYRARREEAIRLQAQAAQLQAQLADARLAALRTQLNPHFLFNTLHAVSALVERDPKGVRRMIARLSELLRTTLDGAEEQEVPLEEELAFIQRYLEIMQIRFQGRLVVNSRIASDVQDALVPNLLLQPLVENAIKHGVSKIADAGRIEIQAERHGDSLVLRVRDNGPPLEEHTLRADEGIGLRNTRARLSQLYGPDQKLVLRTVKEGGVLAEVTIPFHTHADLRTTSAVAHA
jgi:two-component system, LytTR family, sensor kinase